MHKNNYLIKINDLFSSSMIVVFAVFIFISGLYAKYWNTIVTEHITLIEKNNPGYEALSLFLFSFGYFLLSAYAAALKDKNIMMIMIFFGIYFTLRGLFSPIQF